MRLYGLRQFCLYGECEISILCHDGDKVACHILLLTAERAELGGSLARGNGRGLGHAALVVAGFLELSVDNFLEMGFVALHGGGAEVGGVLIGGLMVFDPVRQLPAVGRTSHGCGVIWGQTGDGRCAGSA